MYGYWGKVLRVNLTNRDYKIESVGKKTWQKFVGGSGYGAKVLLEETPPAVDPLSPENKIIFAVGALQAVKAPGSAKWSVVTKSPLTKTFLDSAGSGHWAPRFKKCGYDALIIEGKSNNPVYLYITDNNVEFIDASHLWGKDTIETTDLIKKELNSKRVSMLNIGPAGERGNPIACTTCDGSSFAGRGGSGAVMGSKKLKAIVADGNLQVSVYDQEKASNTSVNIMRRLARDNEAFTRHGTPMVVASNEKLGNFPLKYWTEHSWSEAEKISAPNYTEVLNSSPKYCANCPIGCHNEIEITEPKKYALKGNGPEYETLGLMGGSFLCSDVKAISKANDICNRMGIDTISTGAFVSFLAECFEKGLITVEDTGGIEVEWGDGDVLVELTELIAKNEGVGALFKEGIRGAAKEIGGGAKELIVEVKNMDYPAHDPRCYLALGVNYATGTRGACHERGDARTAYYPELGMEEAPNSIDKAADYAITSQNVSSFYNQLTICKFMIGCGMTLDELLTIFNAITGWDWNAEDLIEAGNRTFTVQRLINVRDGIERGEDTLPEKIKQPAKEGVRKGRAPVPHQKILSDYYQLRGWNDNGIPETDTLIEIGLEEYKDILKEDGE